MKMLKLWAVPAIAAVLWIAAAAFTLSQLATLPPTPSIARSEAPSRVLKARQRALRRQMQAREP